MFALGKGCYSPNVLEKLCDRAQMLSGFPAAQKTLLKDLPERLTLRRVWEQAERVGADLVRRRNAGVNDMLQGRLPKPGANPPDCLVISPDGARLQNRDLPAGSRWCEYKAAVIYRVTRPEDAKDGTRPDPQPKPHWRFRTTLGRRQGSGKKTYRDPEPETKTYVASTEKIDRFPLYVEFEAKRRGLMEAGLVAVVGDGGSMVWRTGREACEDRLARGRPVVEILDLIHANSHLVAAAKAAFGSSSREGVRWLNSRLGELWAGKAEKLTAALEKKAKELGPCPARCRAPAEPDASGPERKDPTKARDGEPLEDGEDDLPPEVVLWRCRDYFETNRERVRYDRFRKLGLPLTSSHIESGLKQTNARVKGSEKAWRLVHAEEMLALRCQALSEDGRWDGYFDRLRRGDIEVPTRGRMKPIPVFQTEQVSQAKPAAQQYASGILPKGERSKRGKVSAALASPIRDNRARRKEITT